MTFPITLENHITKLMLTSMIYDLWVSGREAARAVVALHLNVGISMIATSPQATGSDLIRARTCYAPASSILDNICIIAAATAYDSLYAKHLGVPNEAIARIFDDKTDALKLMPSEIAYNQQNGIWTDCLEKTKATLNSLQVEQQIKRLASNVYQAIQNQTPYIPGITIKEIVSNSK